MIPSNKKLLTTSSEFELPEGCKGFGSGADQLRINQWCNVWGESLGNFVPLLVLAGSRTAQLEGISAAGATPASRRYTAVADAELLLNGPSFKSHWALPPLNAGVSPALISYVATQFLDVHPIVLAVGLDLFPSFPHLRVEVPSLGPADCLSTGHAMKNERVDLLWERGFSMGLKLRKSLLLAECVPGGTTTAQAVLTALGLNVENLIGGSLRNPPFRLKKEIVGLGIKAADLSLNPSPKELLSALGDPFQPFAVGLLLGARKAGQQVLLAGGSQMLAVLALALQALEPDLSLRQEFVRGVSIGTTSWLIQDQSCKSDEVGALMRLIDIVGSHFQVNLLGIASGLRFFSSESKALRDYELGYIKEGVGAGALALLAQLKGVSIDKLVKACDAAVLDLEDIKIH